MTNACRFCALPDTWRILEKSSTSIAMLSLGPIQEGYSLILPRRHSGCVAEIEDRDWAGFKELAARWLTRLERAYGPLALFEHGRAGCTTSAPTTHCYHAHLHIVPVRQDLAAILAAERTVTWISTPSSDVLEALESFRALAISSPYLLAAGPSGMAYHTIEEPLRPQYLRYLLARSEGVPELCDWVTHPREEVIRSALSKLTAPDDA